MTYGVLASETSASAIQDGHVDPEVFAQHCFEWSFGVAKIEACVDLSPPRVDLTLYILGAKVAQATIDRDHPCVTLGGSIDGFKAVAKICLKFDKPVKIVIDAELCAPLVPCKKWHVEIPLPLAVEAEEQTSLMWGGDFD